MDKLAPKRPAPVLDYENVLKRLPILDLNGEIDCLYPKRVPLMFGIGFYPSLAPLMAYGPPFQRLMRCHGGPGEAIAEVEGPTPEELYVERFVSAAVLIAPRPGADHLDTCCTQLF
jgi:hypothetical protein